MIIRALFLFLLIAFPAAGESSAKLVYLGIENDPYYEPQPLYTGLSLRDIKRPIDGVRLGLRESRVLSRALDIKFELEEILISREGVAEAVREIQTTQPIAVLLDLPSELIRTALEQAGPEDLYINIRDRSDRWRRNSCQKNLLHTIPSYAMLSDALAQYLRFRGWTDVLLLHGETETDLDQSNAARLSASKFGLRIMEERTFELTNDPRRRDRSNIALLTGGVTHHVVWLTDSEGDFGRYVPFATYAPRPIIGSEGLSPKAWHWTFERYGAPQLNQRFRRFANRDMTSEDWSSWIAVKSIIEAVRKAGTAKRGNVREALLSAELSIDLYKGVPGNFRSWNGQLRQPILLPTHNAVIAVAPLDGFEHQFSTLDTLGLDEAESSCER